MSCPGRLACPRRETPGGVWTTPGRTRELPEDLLRQASRRVEVIALIGAALWVLAPALGHLTFWLAHSGDGRWAQFHPLDGIALSSVVVSVALYGYLRTGDRPPSVVMHLALGYMVVVALALGVMGHWGLLLSPPGEVAPTISWIGPVVLMFAAIVPAPPRRMLAAGLVAVSMNPIGMLLAQAAGVYPGAGPAAFPLMHYPDYLLLGVAVVISHVVRRLGQEVSRERELGSYRLGRLLGRGGMGEVYLATHRMLARPAAIKLLRPELLAGGARRDLAVARFRREAEAAARLRSPHTVGLYDFGVTSEGTFYLVMELLEGVDLETLVRRDGPLPASRVVDILRQVCDSLDEAHRAGLVHRDIKPANIHLGRVGLRDDFAKVLDFGLVKSVAGDESLASGEGITPGTPAYMAPEMAQGEGVDGRADLYSLGCVAYYLLTGQVVFGGETAIQVILEHLERPPVPPSRRTARPIPPTLEAIVLACLAKRPEGRPGSAAELSRRLAEVASEPGEPAEWGGAEAGGELAGVGAGDRSEP